MTLQESREEPYEIKAIIDYTLTDNFGKKKSLKEIKDRYFDLKNPEIETFSKNEIIKDYMGDFKPFYAFDEKELEKARILVKKLRI